MKKISIFLLLSLVLALGLVFSQETGQASVQTVGQEEELAQKAREKEESQDKDIIIFLFLGFGGCFIIITTVGLFPEEYDLI